MVTAGHAFFEYIPISFGYSGANAFALQWSGDSGWLGHVFLFSSASFFVRMINNRVLIWHLTAIAWKIAGNKQSEIKV